MSGWGPPTQWAFGCVVVVFVSVGDPLAGGDRVADRDAETGARPSRPPPVPDDALPACGSGPTNAKLTQTTKFVPPSQRDFQGLLTLPTGPSFVGVNVLDPT